MENNIMATRRILQGVLTAIGVCVVLVFFWIASTAIYKGRSLFGTTKSVSGRVFEVSEAGAFDAVFHLEGHKSTFYINRGLEHDFTLSGLQQLTKGREVSISYVSQSAIDIEGQSAHVNRLVVGDSVVFDEMKGIPAYKQ